MERLQNGDPDDKLAAHYKLGQIEYEEENYKDSLDQFKMAQEINPNYYPDFVNLRIAEVAYKLDLLDVAQTSLEICEQVMKRDRHVISLLKGKIGCSNLQYF